MILIQTFVDQLCSIRLLWWINPVAIACRSPCSGDQNAYRKKLLHHYVNIYMYIDIVNRANINVCVYYVGCLLILLFYKLMRSFCVIWILWKTFFGFYGSKSMCQLSWHLEVGSHCDYLRFHYTGRYWFKALMINSSSVINTVNYSSRNLLFW